MKKATLLSFSLITIWGSLAFTTIDDPFAALLKKLADFTKNYPSEKIHLHLDKPYYAIGEDIWFKAYVTDSRNPAPTGYDAYPDPKPDLRTTAYWNPHLVSDTSGKANINFFNTDQVGNYRILIEGIDAFGNLARKTIMYEVK